MSQCLHRLKPRRATFGSTQVSRVPIQIHTGIPRRCHEVWQTGFGTVGTKRADVQVGMGGRPLRTLTSTVRRLGLNDIAIDLCSRSRRSSRDFLTGRSRVPSRKVEEGNDAIGISQRGVALCPAHGARTTTTTASTGGTSTDRIRHNQEDCTPCQGAGISHACRPSLRFVWSCGSRRKCSGRWAGNSTSMAL
jgi:hypothetical protein